jgi:hypothetical protein
MNVMGLVQWMIQAGVILFVIFIIGKTIYEQYTAFKAKTAKKEEVKTNDSGHEHTDI